jgi:hypothetical protein
MTYGTGSFPLATVNGEPIYLPGAVWINPWTIVRIVVKD